MAGEKDFQSVFEELKGVLKQYEEDMAVKDDQKSKYYLEAGYSEKFKRDMFFGSVTIGKGYVSYHLMPVYVFPELLDGISPELKKRMQGKSCFNFTRVDEGLFDELAGLTQAGFDRFQDEGLV